MSFKISSYLFILLLFLPKIVISPIEGLSSVFRYDLVVSMSFMISSILGYILFSHFIKVKIPLSILLILSSYLIFYIINSNNHIVAIGQLLLYLSIVSCFVFGVSTKLFFLLNKRIIKRLILFLSMTSLIHVIWITFGIDDFRLNRYQGDSLVDSWIVFGKFGTISFPYQFSVYISVFLFLLLKETKRKNIFSYFWIIIGFVALVTGSSRITFGALIITLFGLKTLFITPILLLVSPFLPLNKVLSVFINFRDLLLDPSLAMRIINIQNYIDWISIKKVIFGGGAQSFLEFSVQYGKPGPLDMGYLRILTEFGLFGIALIALCLFKFIKLNFSLDTNKYMMRFFIFVLIYLIFNEGLFASKVGHLLSFTLGYMCFNLRFINKSFKGVSNKNLVFI